MKSDFGFFLLIFFTISMSVGLFYNIFGYTLSIFVFALYVFLNKNLSIKKSEMLPLACYVIFLVVKSLDVSHYVGISDYFSPKTFVINMLELVIVSLFVFLDNNTYGNEKKVCAYLFLVLYHLTIIISIGLLASRGTELYRSRGNEGGILLAPQNFTIISAFISMIFVYRFLQYKRHRLLCIGIVLVNFIYVVMSSYTTQLLFFAFGIGLVIFNTIVKKKSTRIFLIVLLILLVILIQTQLVSLLTFLNESVFASNASVSDRINEIIKFLSEGNITGTDFAKRVELISISLKSFAQNPILGIKYSNYNSISGGITIGSHCQWADDLGRYGIIGIIIWTVLLRSIWKKIFSHNNTSIIPVNSSIFLYILVYGFFNPVISEGTVLILFIIQIVQQANNTEVDLLENIIYEE